MSGPPALTVLLGGARSGKSSAAVAIGRAHDGPVTYLATATALDADMAHRIARHRDERPSHWRTIEEDLDLARALSDAGADGGLTIVDCLTLWTMNLITSGLDDDEIVDLATTTADHAAGLDSAVVAISNEVGLGIHPDTELGRRYRDLLGWVNQRWVAASSEAFLLVAGRLLRLEDPSAGPTARHNDASG